MVLDTVGVADPRANLRPEQVDVTVEVIALVPETVVKLSVTTTVVPAAKAPEVLTLTALTLATLELAVTAETPSCKSAVPYLPRLNLN